MPEIFSSKKSRKKSDSATKKAKSNKKNKACRPVDEYSEIMRKEKPSFNHLMSFMPKPQKTRFDSQASNEEIILVLRQHPVALIGKLVALVGAIITPLIVSGLPLADFFPINYIIAMTLGWYMLVFGYAMEIFLAWFFSVFLVTDERIIDVDFFSLLLKDISSAKIDTIQDISSKTGGVLASVVDYGTVHIQTAGEQTEIQFENVPQPAKVASLLNELILEEEREKIEGRVS